MIININYSETYQFRDIQIHSVPGMMYDTVLVAYHYTNQTMYIV